MPGINRLYEETKKSITGFSSGAHSPSPCVFISYKGNDFHAAKAIADTLISLDIDIYFDHHDSMLTAANQNNDHRQVVGFIEDGVAKSTHILAVVSNATKESWWVSFEIGSGRRKGAKIAYVALTDVDKLPSYLRIADKITSDKGLHDWIKNNLPIYYTKSINFSESSVSIPKLSVNPRNLTFY